MLLAKFAARGIRFKSINVGGGLGIDYDNPTANPIPDFAAYFGTFSRLMPQREGREIHFELGRAIVAQCGTLITRALYVKKGLNKKFAIVDAGMTELIRPALYQARQI
jgi:diaminopimelate decarboxylase